MAKKPTYEELEQRVKELEKEAVERRRAEEALRESEERLSAIAEKSPIPTAVGASDGSILSFNEALEELIGYRRAEITDVTDWTNRLCPDKEYRDFVQKNIQQALGGEKQTCTEFMVTRKDGSTRMVDFHTSFFKHGLIIQMIDISERKQAERELLLKNIVFDTSIVANSTADLEGIINQANDSFLRMWGYKSKNEVIGKPILHFIQDGKEAEAIISSLDKTGKWVGEYTARKKDGSTFIANANATILYDETGKKVGYQSSVQDITERKQAEEALRESEKKHREFLENLPDMVYELRVFKTDVSPEQREEILAFIDEIKGASDDALEEALGKAGDRLLPFIDGTILYANKTASQLLGYSLEKLGSINMAEILAPEYFEEVLKNTWKILAREGQAGVEYELVTVDGKRIPVNINSTLRGAEFPFLIQGVVRDVTKRKLAEEEKKKLESQLQRAQTMETIGTLAGGVAHDLNNILSGLVSYPELLLMQMSEENPLRGPILTIQKSGEKAAAIVQDLLTLARRGVAVTEVVNLNSIVSEYLISPEYERLKDFHPNTNLEVNLQAGLLNILGSPVHLSKTVMNLVSNAAEAMPSGGKILISTENRYIDKPIEGYDNVKEGDYVILTITDTGVGISPKDMERVFEPFYTKKVMGRSGTGLGMAVVWGTVKDHKGYIDIKSAEGKGSSFTLYFPITRKELAEDQSPVSIKDYVGKGESILVVDDVAEQRDIASRILIELGYSVTTASSGKEAVDYLKDNSADLLILDMIMDPGIDGLDTYKRIIEFHPKQKAIIASGFSETKRVKEAQRLGAGAYVKKPFLLEKIGLAVRAELDK